MHLHRAARIRPRLPRSAAALVAVVALAACQPVDEPLPDVGEQAGAPSGDDDEAMGAPDETVPGDLAGLTERTDPEAERWQPEPRPAEATVELDGREWAGAAVTYVAAGADRALVARVDGGGLSTERVSFVTLGLEPLPDAALADLPELAGLVAPVDLAAAGEERFDDCDAEPPAVQVRFATGAPATWEGDGWAQPPRWRATVTDAADRGVRLDATTGEPDGGDPCVDVVREPDDRAGEPEVPEGGPGMAPDR